MTRSAKSTTSSTTTTSAQKATVVPMLAEFKRSVIAQATDDVTAKLTGAFFEVAKNERWGKRDLSQISGLNETAIGHILSGRRKNLTVETIALLARAMQKRPELVLHDTRPKGNEYIAAQAAAQAARLPAQPNTTTTSSAASASTLQDLQQYPKASAVQSISTQQRPGALVE